MTTFPDIINGSFECIAGLMVALHCRRVLIDKEVKGVSYLATTFFTLWGFWNLYYYPHLDQIVSFFGGLSIVTANTFWLYLMWKYRTK
jgi:hypothetical protein